MLYLFVWPSVWNRFRCGREVNCNFSLCYFINWSDFYLAGLKYALLYINGQTRVLKLKIDLLYGDLAKKFLNPTLVFISISVYFLQEKLNFSSF